jgi:hypothetical protein
LINVSHADRCMIKTDRIDSLIYLLTILRNGGYDLLQKPDFMVLVKYYYFKWSNPVGKKIC